MEKVFHLPIAEEDFRLRQRGSWYGLFYGNYEIGRFRREELWNFGHWLARELVADENSTKHSLP